MPRVNLQTQDARSLANYHQELLRLASALESYTMAIRDDGFTALEVPNNTIGMRGLEYVSKFIEGIRQAICLAARWARVRKHPRPASQLLQTI